MHAIISNTSFSFPPIIKGPASAAGEISNIFTPSASLASSEIWSQEARDKLRVKKYKKAELDSRRKEVSYATDAIIKSSVDSLLVANHSRN